MDSSSVFMMWLGALFSMWPTIDNMNHFWLSQIHCFISHPRFYGDRDKCLQLESTEILFKREFISNTYVFVCFISFSVLVMLNPSFIGYKVGYIFVPPFKIVFKCHSFIFKINNIYFLEPCEACSKTEWKTQRIFSCKIDYLRMKNSCFPQLPISYYV